MTSFVRFLGGLVDKNTKIYEKEKENASYIPAKATVKKYLWGRHKNRPGNNSDAVVRQYKK